MAAINSIAIFDIGKTNKKFFLLNEHYKIVFERTAQFAETTDDDGDNCEDLKKLNSWIRHTLGEALLSDKYLIKAVNFSTYGASFVFLDYLGHCVGHLYNYLKPFPAHLTKQFYSSYGGEEKLAKETASPVLGSLNSGLQLYRLKQEQPEAFAKLKYALHLPQYISYLITKKPVSDITSIGCHTQLWNFETNEYHEWVGKENIDDKLAPLFSSADVMDISINSYQLKVGAGLHDSSAALIPYLANFTEPFILISTGTWCISFNPFNNEPLTADELKADCLCYMEYNGNSVKASRLFAGYEHEQQTKRLAEHYETKEDYFIQVNFSPSLLDKDIFRQKNSGTGINRSGFEHIDLDAFSSYEEAYHRFMQYIILQQYASTELVMSNDVKRIFVDGGFSKNPVYMNLLSAMFPDKEIFAATVSQATAIGAALAIHKHWNPLPVASDMIELKLYATAHKSIAE
ncbi:MAG: carbohydrate kinase [Sphingobacteriales bacterium]|nr:MAG: carbohydrate kinase [Sphingobacteriales bacterium]